MRGLGIAVLVLALFALVGALSMDVTVSSGTGRVNNIGLIAEQQNYITIGGLMLLVGAVMVIAGRRREAAVGVSGDSRACPMCAETIKVAAVKCKHCGSDLSASPTAIIDQAAALGSDVDKVDTQIWIARAVILAVFIGIILFSLIRHG